MDFELTPEEKAFQKELREFLDKECNENVVAETLSLQGAGPYSKELLRKMGAQKLLAPRWPEKYGGRNMGFMAEAIKVDEITSHHAPFPLDGVELGNAVLISGTEEQKQRFLPGVARGEIDIALGYTEPDAGSDVASIKLRAVDHGDEFILNGQKIYNSEAHACEYHWLLTRTDPTAEKKHQGLSMFIVDLKSPGITIRPLYTMAGLRTNEVFYEDVHVPRANLIGEQNGGWAVIMSALYGSSGGGGLTTGTKNVIKTLVNYVLEEKQDVDDNKWIPETLADIYIKTHVGELMGMQSTAYADLGVSPQYGGGGSVSRLLSGDTRRLLYNTAMQILGPYGQLAKGSKYAPLDGEILKEFLDAPRWTIVHGSQEIQKLLIATRGLGLPRK
ncbi:MAG: acyl-CoA dehydrogenase family protein [Dehalococcoidales bacterium]|nr:acyl-CoA dehydrogenase family protein [Dehalococcoidales bacterium]